MTDLPVARDDAPAASVASPTATVFRCALAVAALFHLAGNPAVGFGSRDIALVPVQLIVGAAAVAVLVRPNRGFPLLVLAAAVPVSAWFEAPMVGNHWVLAAAICLTYLLARLVSALRRDEEDTTWSLFAPTARVVLLIAYSFMAFSKLNSGFFDPVTSCAVFYQDQITSSWGLSALSVAEHPGLGRAVAVGAACVELSVPVLLTLRRTRRFGVPLAMGFHWTLALDLDLHFWDFSALLFACFLLFLDEGQIGRLITTFGRVWGRRRASIRMLLVTLGLAWSVVVTLAGALGGPVALTVIAFLMSHVAWWVLGTAALTLVGVTVRRPSPAAEAPLRPRAAAMLLVPGLVLFNGLTPYLEIKTGFGWNMYSNLRTVASESNHLLVPSTWDLTGLQEDRVLVLSSSDDRLTERAGYEFVWSEFREYAHDNPGESVIYRRGGETFDAATLSDDRATSGTVSELSRRLQSFRAVDVSGSERCLDSYGPAR